MKSYEYFADAATVAVLLLGQGESQIVRTDAAAFDEDAAEFAGRRTVLRGCDFSRQWGRRFRRVCGGDVLGSCEIRLRRRVYGRLDDCCRIVNFFFRLPLAASRSTTCSFCIFVASFFVPAPCSCFNTRSSSG